MHRPRFIRNDKKEVTGIIIFEDVFGNRLLEMVAKHFPGVPMERIKFSAVEHMLKIELVPEKLPSPKK